MMMIIIPAHHWNMGHARRDATYNYDYASRATLRHTMTYGIYEYYA